MELWSRVYRNRVAVGDFGAFLFRGVLLDLFFLSLKFFLRVMFRGLLKMFSYRILVQFFPTALNYR